MIRCGLIGYGAWGSHHAKVIAGHPEAQLTAIAARTAATCAAVAKEYPNSRVYTDYRSLLETEELDAAIVVLPSYLHFEVAKAVLESGRHSLLEKPMCLAVAECHELNELAQKRGRVLAIGHEMRLSSLWGKVKELIAAGTLGDPRYALVELWRRPYRLGADGWRYDINRVGDWILEEPIHFFDLARWYFQGVAEPKAVFARASANRSDRAELHDHFTATVDFAGGRYAVIAQSLGGWEHHQTVKVAGTDGALWASWSGAMDRTLTPTFALRLQRGSTIADVPIPRAAGEVFELAEQFDRFVEAIRTGVPPTATGADGAWAVRLCFAAKESARTGMPTTL
jgi:myo-inositol 2-dehydrogenase/D-chiro-inositol 1-dehydrogenase